MTNIGLLFLDDLRAFAPWISDRGHAFLDKFGTENIYAPQTIEPPPGLVISLRADSLFDSWPELPWFRRSKRIALLVETAVLDEEISLWIREEVQAKREELGNVVHVAYSTETTETIIREAAHVVATDAYWRAWGPTSTVKSAPPGPWFQRDLPRWSESSTPDREDFIRLVVCGLCLPSGSPVLVDALAGKRIDLVSGATDDMPEGPICTDSWMMPAVLPNGNSWIESDHHSGIAGDDSGWYLRGNRQSGRCRGGYGRAIAIEPSGRLAWTGGRMCFDWRVMLDDGPVLWTRSNHSWPDGHAKKLYSYKDNGPLWVHLAPDAGMLLSVYEHDALLAPAPPIRWKKSGSVMVAEKTRGDPRAVFFIRRECPDSFPADPAKGDEDARDEFAVVCLGPGPERCYSVDLSQPTWRIVGDTAQLLGGPDGGWVVFNSRHEPVMAASGRLLAGWHKWVVFMQDQELFRFDLETDETTHLCTVDLAVDFAIAIPGSPNVVVVSIQDSVARYRVV